MFFPEGQIRVFVYGRPVSMRLSYDGLYALAKHTMQQDPLSGNLFAFINRRANQIKVLYFDRSGWCVWAKRLEKGCLLSNWDHVSTREMDWTGLKLLLEGIEPKRGRRRYQKTAPAPQNVSTNAGA
ncbi:transposase (plasmid) [Burkholderia sp. PAMC 28687]|uniref:IS66 family insertion sequence element accessory protein TnpB n=1 Tax=Burkholderia sp. PAMC 28687 TaxID=1795874 RepID=UPI000781AD34|nr:IS66 family insertion sequence element accessory protein TnpB [Burkholderia sp. PAMC 28687]AMM18759.1 transposase [Burkholderia sp. PAMC 28687]